MWTDSLVFFGDEGRLGANSNTSILIEPHSLLMYMQHCAPGYDNTVFCCQCLRLHQTRWYLPHRGHMPTVTYLRLDGSVAPSMRHGIVHRYVHNIQYMYIIYVHVQLHVMYTLYMSCTLVMYDMYLYK